MIWDDVLEAASTPQGLICTEAVSILFDGKEAAHGKEG